MTQVIRQKGQASTYVVVSSRGYFAIFDSREKAEAAAAILAFVSKEKAHA